MKSSNTKGSACERGSLAANGGPFARSLQRAASAALLAMATLGTSAPALAGVPGLDVSVTSLAPRVPGPVPNTFIRPISYSVSGGATYKTAYVVQMTASSPVNAVFLYLFTGIRVAAESNPSSGPAFGTVTGLRTGDSCTPVQGSPHRLDCVIGAIQAGSTVSFTVLVPSPVATDSTERLLSVSWEAQTGQGQPNPSNLVHEGSQDVTLKVGSAEGGVQSYVEPGQALGVVADGTTTEVKPPKPVTVDVRQQAVSYSCSPHYTKCFESTVTIVDVNGGAIPFDSTDPLVIDLIRSTSSMKRGGNIGNAQLSYSSDGVNWVPILECTEGTLPRWVIPWNQSRCVVPAVKKATTGTFVGLDGTWHFQIIALSNGKIGW